MAKVGRPPVENKKYIEAVNEVYEKVRRGVL